MSGIDRELMITSPALDVLNVQPYGHASCDEIVGPTHEFTLAFEMARIIYRICCRCGTVQMKERGRFPNDRI